MLYEIPNRSMRASLAFFGDIVIFMYTFMFLAFSFWRKIYYGVFCPNDVFFFFFRNVCASFHAMRVLRSVFCRIDLSIFLSRFTTFPIRFCRSCVSVWYCVFSCSVACAYPFCSHICVVLLFRDDGYTSCSVSCSVFHVLPVLRYP